MISDAIEILDIPQCDVKNPADLEAWYGNFGFFDHWRKIVLANTREIERARAVLEDRKITESRLDDLARMHPRYTEFLECHLYGRMQREKNVLTSFGR